jgi:hypothetical protein
MMDVEKVRVGDILRRETDRKGVNMFTNFWLVVEVGEKELKLTPLRTRFINVEKRLANQWINFNEEVKGGRRK